MTGESALALSGASRPRLPRGVRLKHDDVRNEWLLLAPERVLKTNAIAVEILKRCTGKQSLDAIVDDLASTFSAERSRVETDVRALLTELATKRLVDL
ncbi:MAG: pyrroloquinoline quinone biosynthesis peptide chaperone PqqD [Hyphomicrobiales bacterium]|nr:pyrroloquinoline quinone biosynthesis peptide chaperone PqqD [Hyphomicrobiales bacterium]